MPQRVFISDCEGPISKNDNAFELAKHFIPDGGSFFKLLSRYDDVLAFILRRPSYSAGYTLKLLVPFLIAYGATNESITMFSRKNMSLIRDAGIALKQIRHNLPAYIVSTSYSPYIDALCTVLAFPKEHTFSTSLDLDAFSLATKEMQMLQELRGEMLNCPSIEIPDGAQDIEDLSPSTRRTVARLDAIFCDELPETQMGEILEEIHPIGSTEKARAVADITEDLDLSCDRVFYVGDSITDAEVLRMVKDSGGVAVSFNGNRYAVEQAEISVLSSSLMPIAGLAEIFSKMGRRQVLDFAERESSDRFSPLFHTVSLITSKNFEEITSASMAFRREVRGESIASLG